MFNTDHRSNDIDYRYTLEQCLSSSLSIDQHKIMLLIRYCRSMRYISTRYVLEQSCCYPTAVYHAYEPL
jgi:hypothetical protein